MAAPADGDADTHRPKLRVTDIFRRHGEAYGADHALVPIQRKVLRNLGACRTAALGGHLEVCDHCGFERPAYNSCRDRHCPGCQAAASRAWLEQRLERVLPTHHFHVVFTLPEELRPLALRNGVVVYDILLRTAAEALDVLGRQRLRAQLGVTSVLHTWTRAMLYHPHVHCVVSGGGLALDGSRWVATPRHFLVPVAVLRKLFRGLVRRRLHDAFHAGELDLGGACADVADPSAFAKLLRSLHRKRWVVYCKPPFAGPEEVFRYLGRYTHRVAISDHRLVAVEEHAVTFRTKQGHQITVEPAEFIRRFLLHVLPSGFHKIRHTGIYAATNVHTRLHRAHELLGAHHVDDEPAAADTSERQPTERACPSCGIGVLLRLPLLHAPACEPLPLEPLDSS